MGTEHSKNSTRPSQNLSEEEVKRLLEKQKREFDAKLRNLQQQNSYTAVENARFGPGAARPSTPSTASAAVRTPPGQNSYVKIESQATIVEPLTNLKVTSHISSSQPSSIERTRMPYSYNQSELQNTAQNPQSSSDKKDYALREGHTSTKLTAVNSEPAQAKVVTPTTAPKLYPDLGNRESNLPRPNEPLVSNPSSSRGSPFVVPSPPSSQKISDFVFVEKNRVPPPHKCVPSAPPGDFKREPSSNDRNRSNSRSWTYKERKERAQKEGDELNCRTCHKKYGLVIYNCELGHSSCADCKGRRCGVCGTKVTEMRNITLEAVIAEMKVPCLNEKDGCIYILKMAEMDDHMKVCLYSDLTCPLATVYGRCFWKGKISEMKSHFSDVHPQNRQAEIDKEMQLFNFVDNSRVVHLMDNGAYNFLFNLKVDKVEQKLYLCIQLIGTPSSAAKWIYEVHVYNKREPRRKFVHSDECFSHVTPLDVIFKESKCVAIPLAYVMGYVNEARLTYKLFIKKDVERFENSGRGRGRGRGRGQGRGRDRGAYRSN